MKSQKSYSGKIRSVDGEKRLAKAVIYRALRDVINYYNGVCSSENKLCIWDIKRVIYWFYSDKETTGSFLFWCDAATYSLSERTHLIQKCRKKISQYRFLLDTSSTDTLM